MRSGAPPTLAQPSAQNKRHAHRMPETMRCARTSAAEWWLVSCPDPTPDIQGWVNSRLGAPQAGDDALVPRRLQRVGGLRALLPRQQLLQQLERGVVEVRADHLHTSHPFFNTCRGTIRDRSPTLMRSWHTHNPGFTGSKHHCATAPLGARDKLCENYWEMLTRSRPSKCASLQELRHCDWRPMSRSRSRIPAPARRPAGELSIFQPIPDPRCHTLQAP